MKKIALALLLAVGVFASSDDFKDGLYIGGTFGNASAEYTASLESSGVTLASGSGKERKDGYSIQLGRNVVEDSGRGYLEYIKYSKNLEYFGVGAMYTPALYKHFSPFVGAGFGLAKAKLDDVKPKGFAYNLKFGGLVKIQSFEVEFGASYLFADLKKDEGIFTYKVEDLEVTRIYAGLNYHF